MTDLGPEEWCDLGNNLAGAAACHIHSGNGERAAHLMRRAVACWWIQAQLQAQPIKEEQFPYTINNPIPTSALSEDATTVLGRL